MFTPVSTANLMHSDYPRNDENANTIWSSMVKKVRTQLPLQYQNAPWIHDFIKDPTGYVDRSQALCIKVTSHRPVEPFSHFENVKV